MTVRPRHKEGEWGHGEGPSLAITTMFLLELTYVFLLSVSIRKVASDYPFCVLIHLNSYTFEIDFGVLIFLSNAYLIFNFYMLDVIIGHVDVGGKGRYPDFEPHSSLFSFESIFWFDLYQ